MHAKNSFIRVSRILIFVLTILFIYVMVNSDIKHPKHALDTSNENRTHRVEASTGNMSTSVEIYTDNNKSDQHLNVETTFILSQKSTEEEKKPVVKMENSQNQDNQSAATIKTEKQYRPSSRKADDSQVQLKKVSDSILKSDVESNTLAKTEKPIMLKDLSAESQTDSVSLDLYDVGKPVPAAAEDVECVNHSLVQGLQVCLYADDVDQWVSFSLRKQGYWERNIVKQFIKALDEYPSACVIDLGANIGQYSLIAAAKGHRVIAVEPSPYNILRLHKSAHKNNATDMIQIVQHVVIDHRDSVSLQLKQHDQGGTIVCGSSNAPHKCIQKSKLLTVRSILMNDLASLLADHQVAIIKIDIEGSEHRALAHSNLLFEQLSIPYVFMEWLKMSSLYNDPPDAETRALISAIVTSFTARGYKAYGLPTKGIALDPKDFVKWPKDIMWKKEKQFEIRK